MNEISHDIDDPYRLPRHVRPTRDQLTLEPDLAGATCQGRATIALTVQQLTRVIVCNALELAIDEAIVEAV
jgi:puromycin-sensitive aminopeptidase